MSMSASYNNLQEFVEKLKQENLLVEVDAPVDAHLEIAEIHRRVIAANGPALLFRNVKGKSFPVATNLFGTAKRVDLAFSRRGPDFISELVSLAKDCMPPTLSGLWGKRDTLLKGMRVGTKSTSNTHQFQQDIPNADLTQLPAITSWEEDGGPFLTLPLVHTKGQEGDNIGIYRMQIFSAEESGMHFQIGKGGGFHLYEAEQKNQNLPVNVYLGGPPSLLLSAIAPLPENIPEFLLASLVQGRKMKRSRLGEHPPFLDFEFCLSGYVPPSIRRPEGPFGDHYGYYSLIHDYPVFRPKHIYHRKNAIFPATVVGKPRQEDFYLGDYLQEMLSPLFPLVMPQVKDLWSYGETGFHSLSATVIQERYARESMSAAFRILGEGQLSLTKFLLAVDKPMDLRDFKSVFTYVLERIDWRTDLFIFAKLSMDSLDYAGPKINHGAKGVMLGIGEAKRKLPTSFTTGDLPSFVKDVRVYCPGCLVVEISSYEGDKECIESLCKVDAFKDWPFLVAVDNAKKASRSDISFLWTTFTRFDPSSDIYARDVKCIRNHLSYEGPVAIDARMKTWYPKELFCDDDTRKLVDKRWKEYFPKENIDMGSSDDAHLF